MKNSPAHICFLSEINLGWLNRASGVFGWHGKLGLFVFLWTLLTVFLGHMAGANAVSIPIVPSIKTDNNWVQLSPKYITYGYLVETNHAFFLLLLAPIFIFVSGLFLNSAESALRNLSVQRRLVRRRGVVHANLEPSSNVSNERQLALDESPDFNIQQQIASSNRKIFRWLIVFLPILLVGREAYVEYENFHLASIRSTHDVGHVQAPFVKDWIEWFNGSTTESERYAKFKNLRGSEFDATLKSVLGSVSKETLNHWQIAGAIVPLKYVPPRTGADELLVSEVQKGDFCLCNENAVQKGLLRLTTGNWTGSNRGLMLWHEIFLVSLVLLEGTFHAFAAWMICKVIFWLWIISSLLPKGKNKVFRFRLLLKDPRRAYGLYELYKPYNHIIVLLLIGAFVFTLIWESNVVRVTIQDLGTNLQQFTGSILTAFGILIPGIALIFGPVLYFNLRIANMRARVIEKLDLGLISHHNPKYAIAVESTKKILGMQSLFPKDSKYFKALSLATVIFFVLPVLLSMTTVPKEVEVYVNIAKTCQEFMRGFADWIYGFTK